MTPQTAPAPVPLQVLTGFLGAGKTTLLNSLLRDAALAETLVIVNEFGEVGLDHLLIETASDGVVLMESGCLCCTIRGELAGELEDLLRRRDNGRIAPFRRVIVETTGLADPVPILNTVLQHPYLSRRFELDGVVTVIDAVNGLATLEAHEEALRQAAVADRIVVTKTDLVDDPGRLDALRDALAALNPGAVRLDAARGEATAAALIGLGLFDLAAKPAEVEAWLAIDAALGAGDAARHGPGGSGAVTSVVLTADRPLKAQTLDLFWTLLTSTHGPKLLRLKGLVDLAEHPEGPVVMHAARLMMHPPQPLPRWPGERRTRLVLIVRDLDPAVVERLWLAFLGTS